MKTILLLLAFLVGGFLTVLAGLVALPLFIIVPTLLLVGAFLPLLRFLIHGAIFAAIFYLFYRIYERFGKKGLFWGILGGLAVWLAGVILIFWAVMATIEHFIGGGIL